MDYEKISQLIKDNSGDFDDPDQLDDFMNSYDEPTDDEIAEYIDGICPIYYSEIMEEWQNNPQAHGMTAEVFGEVDPSGDVYKIMTTDLYCYYQEQLSGDFAKLTDLIDEKELEEIEAENEAEAQAEKDKRE